ncbi:MAG: dephospho-CoA kinase [Chloroflexi bacterium RBG_13_52_12]|nr:MAG: dephospho-CoA kinase [Chloroflexi bacterium RBG_13_52_12]
MKVIGLTGGIGSGKSTAARFLAELGAVVIDLDKVGHEVLKKGTRAWKQVLAEFGKSVFDTSGDIDRSKLAKIVFYHSMALSRLNQIIHPAIDKAIEKEIQECRRRGVKVVVLEAAAMLEAGKSRQVDELWVTVASESTVLQRIKERSGYTDDEARARIKAQLKNEERIKKADVVIDTDCTLEELKTRVMIEWHKLLKRM